MAKEELEKGIRSELKVYPDISKYDTIFIGFYKLNHRRFTWNDILEKMCQSLVLD